MNEYYVKRLALVLAIQAEIEGMKAANAQHEFDQQYTMEDFQKKAEELRTIAYCHDQQL